MDNQHRQIKGYRELSQEEIDLMNEVKELGVQLDAVIQRCAAFDVRDGKTRVGTPDDVSREAARWRAIARTDLQTGLMALTRSIAKPGFF